MNNHQHERMIEHTRALLQAKLGPDAPLESCCMQRAFAGTCVLRANGYTSAIPQAGSASWPLYPADQEPADPAPTHYSYVYDGKPLSDPHNTVQLMLGHLPEIHCWIAIPETLTIIDFTTGFLPLLCEQRGLPWENGTPDRYIWEDARHLHERRILYKPDVRAIAAVLALNSPRRQPSC